MSGLLLDSLPVLGLPLDLDSVSDLPLDSLSGLDSVSDLPLDSLSGLDSVPDLALDSVPGLDSAL